MKEFEIRFRTTSPDTYRQQFRVLRGESSEALIVGVKAEFSAQGYEAFDFYATQVPLIVRPSEVPA